MVSALRSRNVDAAFCEMPSQYGHDAFLVETKEQSEMITGFLERAQHSASNDPVIQHEPGRRVLSRLDYAMIAELVEPNASVLDLGCGEGELLAWLGEKKHVRGQGVEIDTAKVRKAIARGVSAYQSDLEEGLADYPDGAFDFVILSQTLQEMRYPMRVLREMLRVGRHGIVAFPNFGHWTTRLSHLLSGRSPKTELFPYDWYESPNLHFLTIEDFVLLCRAQQWVIEHQIFLQGDKQVKRFPNLLAETAVFSIRG
jgi:methionine biosynthesis protein MetW